MVPSTQSECNSLTQGKPEVIALVSEDRFSVRKTSGAAEVLYEPPPLLKHLLVICMECGLDSLLNGNPQQFVMGPK